MANKVNILVAENGFGKSSITAAFRAAESGKMKLQKNEFRDGNMAPEQLRIDSFVS